MIKSLTVRQAVEVVLRGSPAGGRNLLVLPPWEALTIFRTLVDRLTQDRGWAIDNYTNEDLIDGLAEMRENLL